MSIATLQLCLALLSHLTTLALLLFLSRQLPENLRFLRWVRHQASGPLSHFPRVSILVPARNEEATIHACVQSLLQQEYPNYEVIVLNDASTDGTATLLNALAATSPHLQVVHAYDELPSAWNGKSYACHRLAQRATGEWLLFTDADTEHTPQSIAQGIRQALALHVDLLSAMPAQETRTWSERVLVSFILDFLPLIGLNLRAIWMGKGEQTAGNGQYLLVKASSYQRAGGHAAIYDATLDDFALARHFRLNSMKVALVEGTQWLKCRMYHNAQEVWEGFSRSLMLGLDNSSVSQHSIAWAALFVWGYACLFVNPYLHLFVGMAWGASWWLALFEIFWLLLLRGVVTWRLRRSLLEIITTPLAAWGVMALGLAALYRRWRGEKIRCKGRLYTN